MRIPHLTLLLLLCCCSSASAQAVLLTQPDSTRAVSLDSLTQTGEPYALDSFYGRTRISLFALGIQATDAQQIEASAEDASHRIYQLKVEYVGRVPNFDWLSQISFALPDGMTDVGDLLLSISYQGVRSNRVRVGVGHIGGGLPDDSLPASVPPYTIKGRVLSNGVALSDAVVTLSGAQSAQALTDAQGNYSLTVAQAGKVSVSASKQFYSFTQGQSFNPIYGNRVLNFEAARINYSLSGKVTDDNGAGIDNLTISLGDRTTTTQGGGNYSFILPAGFSYTVAPSLTPIFSFPPQTIELTDNTVLNFKGVRRTYQLNGRAVEGSVGLSGLTVQLSDSRITTTDVNGNFSFSVLAGLNYTVDLQSNPFFDTTPQSFRNVTSDLSTVLAATRRRYTVTGQVRDGSKPLTNIGIGLYEIHGLMFKSANVDENGYFSLSDVQAGFTYLLTPINTQIYGFQGQVIQTLDGDKNLDFQGTRLRYSIYGRVADPGGVPLEGVTITLTGGATQTVTTGSDGAYSFGGLPAAGDYQVSLSKSGYVFRPPIQSFVFLYQNQRADFTSLKTYTMTGRVTDTQGNNLLGVTMNLNGPEPARTITSGDGTYSLTVTTSGDYTLTPAKEQNFYAFTPQSFSLTTDRVINFVGAFNTATQPESVLEFDGTQMTVDYSYFWPEFVNLGHFFWEVWAMPGANTYTRYMISDGYGGAHALLFGFNGSRDPGRYNLAGNIWSPAGPVSFFSDEGPAPNEWGHFAVGWDGQYVITYFDGVPVGKQPFAGPRQTLGPNSGASWLFIGGSDHQNLIGRIAQVRGFEDRNPREASPESAFTPETLFSRDGNFLSYYLRPSQSIADMSLEGYRGSSHPGQLRGMLYGYINPCPDCPLPKYVVDSSAPAFTNPNPQQVTSSVDSPQSPPADALIFDSFSRRNSTYILGGAGGLGSVERGGQNWQTGVSASSRQPFGILNGRAVVLADNRALAWVDAGASNLKISVGRFNGSAGAGVDTGLALRVVDSENYFFAYTAGGDKLQVGYYQQGARHDLDLVALPSGWHNLEVVTKSDGTLEVFASGAMVYLTNNQTFAAATKAGLYNNSAAMSLANRWDNFTISPAP